mgnify:CR=1 FL=1
MKQKRIIIGWALATATFALFGCNQENPYGPHGSRRSTQLVCPKWRIHREKCPRTEKAHGTSRGIEPTGKQGFRN